MNATYTLDRSPLEPRLNADRIGVIASILCAIHCIAAPRLLIFAPAFGKIWAHPASHWIVALLVVPLAGVMVMRGFKKHRKIWIVVVGLLGITLVIAGSAIPYLNASDKISFRSTSVPAPSASALETSSSEKLPVTSTASCADDTCCPSLAIDDTGKTQFYIPLASIVTTLGGILLICTHIGNLCCVSCGDYRKS